MINEPKIEIKYLIDYDLEVTGTIDETISNPKNLTDDEYSFGKKGLHLNGGYFDETLQEDVGTLLNGSYTFYDEKNMYNGLVGTVMSNDNYEFDENQYFTITTKEPETYIKSLFIYFDNIAGEIATKMSFSDAPNVIYTNNKYIFMRSFGENSTLTSVTVNFLKWSKRNATVKVRKIKTGYTGIYDPFTINQLYYTRDKFSDAENLKFGVTKQEATIDIVDKNGMIMDLYNADLIFKNIEVRLYIDDILEGIYSITSKNSNNNTNIWTFDCQDIPSLRLSDIINPLNVEVDKNNNPIPKSLKYIIDYAIGTVINVKYADDDLEQELENIIIPVPFINGGQTREEVLTKCCQIALLRMYSDKYGNLIIDRGV